MLLFLWLVCPVICAIVASAKHRSAIGWFILGLILPVISVIIVLALGDARPTVIVQNVRGPDPAPEPKPFRREKRCPECAEMVLSDARVCKHCGHRFDQPAAVRQIEALPSPAGKSDIGASAVRCKPAVQCLKLLAEAGHGLDDPSVDAIMTYLEAENGGVEYSRREAAVLGQWVRGLATDGDAVRVALLELKSSVSQFRAFIRAGATIIGDAPTEQQDKLASFFERAFAKS